jgi:small multidrug resistance family-3 protein
MSAFAYYIAPSFAEVVGSFAFWAWLWLGKSVLWLIPGAALLALFAFLLTRGDSAFADHAYGAYGGVFIASSLVWHLVFEVVWPDRWDLISAMICVVCAGTILLGRKQMV